MDLRDALIDWDEPDDHGSNVAHIAEHGLTPQEVESALYDENTTFDVSDSSGRPIAFGSTITGRFICCCRVRRAEPGRSARHPPDHRLRGSRADGVKL